MPGISLVLGVRSKFNIAPKQGDKENEQK